MAAALRCVMPVPRIQPRTICGSGGFHRGTASDRRHRSRRGEGCDSWQASPGGTRRGSLHVRGDGHCCTVKEHRPCGVRVLNSAMPVSYGATTRSVVANGPSVAKGPPLLVCGSIPERLHPQRQKRPAVAAVTRPPPSTHPTARRSSSSAHHNDTLQVRLRVARSDPPPAAAWSRFLRVDGRSFRYRRQLNKHHHRPCAAPLQPKRQATQLPIPTRPSTATARLPGCQRRLSDPRGPIRECGERDTTMIFPARRRARSCASPGLHSRRSPLGLAALHTTYEILAETPHHRSGPNAPLSRAATPPFQRHNDANSAEMPRARDRSHLGRLSDNHTPARFTRAISAMAGADPR
jgi:hypothetical protein